MLTKEQQQAALQDMVTIYNKIDADLGNLRDKQQLFAGLIQGYSAILNPQPEAEETASGTSKKKKSKLIVDGK